MINLPRPLKRYIPLALALITALAWITIYQNHRTSERVDGSAAESGSSPSSRRHQRDQISKERRRSGNAAEEIARRYEELLTKYPSMKIEFREVPDQENGYLQLILFSESWEEPRLPEGLLDELNREKPDLARFEEWFGENHDRLGEIMRISRLEDRSTKGIPLGRLSEGAGKAATEFAAVLRGAAVITAAGGDPESALEYLRGTFKLGEHLSGTEAPTMLAGILDIGIRSKARDAFRTHLLPILAKDEGALESWRQALHSGDGQAERLARTLKGEWNWCVRDVMLPGFINEADSPHVPDDLDGFFASYTGTIMKSMDGISSEGPHRFDVRSGDITLPVSSAGGAHPSAGQALASLRQVVPAIGIQVTKESMEMAALSLLLGKEPLPDPVSGKPFQWDPATRTLSPPEDSSSAVDPVILPATAGD